MPAKDRVSPSRSSNCRTGGDGPAAAEDADGERPGVQVDAAVESVLPGVEPHRGLPVQGLKLVLQVCLSNRGHDEHPAVAADGAGITAFRGILSLQPAPLLNFVVRRRRGSAIHCGERRVVLV